MSKMQKHLVVRKLTTDFREAVNIETSDICMPKEGEICVKNKYVGINADDINVSKGRQYFRVKNIPFGAGLEGIGTVAAVGKGVTGIKVGDPMAYITFVNHCAFAEYTCVPVNDAFPVPAVSPEYLVLLGSGLTAVIGVNQYGKFKKGDKVLITAASGGLGHLAVQLAKSAGCYVIGTCSTKEKEKFLTDLGCDRTINYKTGDLLTILSKDYPEGLDVIWETIGGQVFEICLQNLAVKGRLLIMGGTSGYKTEEENAFPKTEVSALREIIFYRGATIIGGNVDVYKERLHEYYKILLRSYAKGDIIPVYNTRNGQEEFLGMEGIIKAVEHLYQGEHLGKILAKIY